MNTTAPTTYPLAVRWLITADTILVTGFALLLLVLASPISNATDLPVNFLRGAGGILVPWAAFLAITWKQPHIPKGSVTTVVLVNAAWVCASLGVVAANLVDPNALGVTFILFQASGVLLLAGLQYSRWKTMP